MHVFFGKMQNCFLADISTLKPRSTALVAHQTHLSTSLAQNLFLRGKLDTGCRILASLLHDFLMSTLTFAKRQKVHEAALCGFECKKNKKTNKNKEQCMDTRRKCKCTYITTSARSARHISERPWVSAHRLHHSPLTGDAALNQSQHGST